MSTLHMLTKLLELRGFAGGFLSKEESSRSTEDTGAEVEKLAVSLRPAEVVTKTLQKEQHTVGGAAMFLWCQASSIILRRLRPMYLSFLVLPMSRRYLRSLYTEKRQSAEPSHREGALGGASVETEVRESRGEKGRRVNKAYQADKQDPTKLFEDLLALVKSMAVKVSLPKSRYDVFSVNIEEHLDPAPYFGHRFETTVRDGGLFEQAERELRLLSRRFIVEF
ncbi:hypothetical protein HPB47_020905 [Ixodes persulcatus]|uniref:Uncharacterized protein n=1 Tax=Ixodes persulcatus TaxID=34615 RepID=A0AC60QH87_IXOPE|nr:hypothetical protein HPB47_020905 [Ixodes persulcatus]